MGATRPAFGERCNCNLVAFVCFSCHYPDARRVAPISACVFLQRFSGNLKCNKNGRAFDADFEHPA